MNRIVSKEKQEIDVKKFVSALNESEFTGQATAELQDFVARSKNIASFTKIAGFHKLPLKGSGEFAPIILHDVDVAFHKSHAKDVLLNPRGASLGVINTALVNHPELENELKPAAMERIRKLRRVR